MADQTIITNSPVLNGKSSDAFRRERQAALLGGLSFGRAYNQLRKLLLFTLAGKAGLLACHRCKNQIEAISEFSIEHKVAWEGAPDPLFSFFDLGNIAFSHLKCNVGAAKKNNRKHASAADYRRVGFAKYYEKHGDELNARRRKKRRSGARAPYKN